MSHFAIPVHLYMTTPVESVSPGTSLKEAHRRMRELNISSLAVTGEDGRLAGVLSRTDILREGRIQAGARPGAALLTVPEKTASELMTAQTLTVGPEDFLSQAADLMTRERAHRIFVVEGDKPVGVVSTRDLLHAIRDKRVNKPISEFMSTPVFSVRHSEPLSLATDRLAKALVSGLVVVEGDLPVGLFTQIEALASRHMPAETRVEDAMSYAMLCLATDTPLHRAAAQAAALDVRRVVAMSGPRIEGILTGLDLARAAAA